MFGKLILALVPFAALGIYSQSERTQPAANPSAPVVQPARQLAPPPSLPASFRIQFTTSAGDTVDTVAVFVADVPRKTKLFAGDWENPERYELYRTPAVEYTVDHPSLYTFQYQGPVKIKTPIDLTYYPNLSYWSLALGTGTAKSGPGTFVTPSAVPSQFSYGTINYFNLSIN